jgi:hypothetical protein
VDADLDVSAVPEGLEVRGVAKLLRRAMRNLLENARRYSTGDITVVLRSDGLAKCACATAARRPPASANASLSPSTACPGASERAGGVGLGLALVRSIAGRHNGSVRCEDHDGSGGACFVLRLPLTPGPTPQWAKPSAWCTTFPKPACLSNACMRRPKRCFAAEANQVQEAAAHYHQRVRSRVWRRRKRE